jgi:isopentenyldiphosphate isomerase
MINPSELIFCVDEKNNPIQSLPRTIAHRNHIWHRTTDIWVTNPSRAQILCHKRSAKKDAYPSLFDPTFGGHLLAEDTPQQNAERELSEEIGIQVDRVCLRFIGIIPLVKQFEYQYRYHYSLSVDIGELVFEREEIDAIFWKDIHELILIYKEQKDATWVYRERELEMLQSIQIDSL